MVPSSILERVFAAASIQRWNDRVRPVDLTELDKQAHKAMIAFVLARFEEDRGAVVDWIRLIEGLLFEFFPRVVLTDIKAPFFHRLMKGHGAAINRHVLREVSPDLRRWDPAFTDRFEAYLLDPASGSLERRITGAAHYLATQWEFKIIEHASSFLYGMETTKEEIERQVFDYIDLAGVRRIHERDTTYGFVDLCGQLRFQQRWAQTPRLPVTSVLGHSFFVAAVAYLISLEIGACPRRRLNNFLTGLFHDLPEIFTRDIISPLKRSVEGLAEFIEEEEKLLVEEKLLPLLPEPWRPGMRYYLYDPFRTRLRENGAVRTASAGELHDRYNEDRYDPVDGELVKGCDELGAFAEACKSIETGVRPPHLLQAADTLSSRYASRRTGPVVWAEYFSAFAIPGMKSP